jgi:PAS domain S-box-containing protein
MSWTVFVSPEDLAKMKRYHELRRKEGGGAPDSYEFTFVDRQGQTRDVFLSIALIPGTMISVASLMDISKGRRGKRPCARARNGSATWLDFFPRRSSKPTNRGDSPS